MLRRLGQVIDWAGMTAGTGMAIFILWLTSSGAWSSLAEWAGTILPWVALFLGTPVVVGKAVRWVLAGEFRLI
jgi:hypothetical protein